MTVMTWLALRTVTDTDSDSLLVSMCLAYFAPQDSFRQNENDPAEQADPSFATLNGAADVVYPKIDH